ncbi:hypothetical protein BCR44DRAFT_1264319 [Catenaria anguillulae PL171]|uniref:Uncharacterized protein n=1 Tax=Catenaria anguillulae PL171 TaxID=765915 RepID=A0A1Y2HCX1_9FUNG|nr:hypothetical protein BCR44DRAFT_1264319 [Catenaria anguillulae PL171]
MTDSAATVRLLLPDGKPARGIFPGLAADLDTPVFAACSFVPSSPADNARQNVACPLAPTADARARFQQCQTSKCSLLQVELDHEASKVEHVDSDSAWLYDSRDAIAAATRLHDRTLAHCTTEYWAAYGSLCISLDAPVLRNMTLPQLPSMFPAPFASSTKIILPPVGLLGAMQP